ncbi:hypothetical protein U3A55_09805 [Salarchaeum sp. III]
MTEEEDDTDGPGEIDVEALPDDSGEPLMKSETTDDSGRDEE